MKVAPAASQGFTLFEAVKPKNSTAIQKIQKKPAREAVANPATAA
jgi:hypothetical protein